MSRQERRGYTGEDETGQHCYRQDVLLDPFAPLRLGRTEDDALDFVVNPATCLERVGIRDAGKIVKVCLEEPESLRSLATNTRGFCMIVGPPEAHR